MTGGDRWLVWSIEHGAWWRPAKWGYTEQLAEAGRYSRAEADGIVAHANLVTVNECAIPAEAVSCPHLLAAVLRDVIANHCGNSDRVFCSTCTPARRLLDSAEAIAREEHGHCECRTTGCGHLDIRHHQGACSYPGCKCEEWS